MLIGFAGIDGSGKSSQVVLLNDYLRYLKIPVFISKAYGAKEKSCFEAYIRNCDQLSIMFLFQAMHANQRLLAHKALLSGKTVIADRWDESYLAYHRQFGILSQDKNLREKLNHLAFNDMSPDITFYLRVPAKTAIARTRIRGATFFDKKSIDYHEAIATALDSLASERDWVVIDGCQPQMDIHLEIVQRVNRVVKNIKRT